MLFECNEMQVIVDECFNKIHLQLYGDFGNIPEEENKPTFTSTVIINTKKEEKQSNDSIVFKVDFMQNLSVDPKERKDIYSENCVLWKLLD